MQTAYVRLEEDLMGTTISGIRGVSVAIYLFLLVFASIAGWRAVSFNELESIWFILLLGALGIVAALADHHWHGQSLVIEQQLRAALGTDPGGPDVGAANAPIDLATLGGEIKAVSKIPIPSSTLVLDGEEEITPVSESDILRSISSLGEGKFLILSFAAQEYIQVAMDSGQLVLERRDGDAESHFRAAQKPDCRKVLSAFLCFLNHEEMPQDIVWERVSI